MNRDEIDSDMDDDVYESPPVRTAVSEDPFAHSLRQNRLFWLMALGFALLLAGVVYLYHRHTVALMRADRQERDRKPLLRSLSMTGADYEEDFLLAQAADEMPPLTNGPAPLNIAGIKQAAYLLVSAEKAYRNGLWELALEHYSQALVLYPNLHDVQTRIGLCQLQLDQYPAAQTGFEQALREQTNAPALLLNLGVLALLRDDDEQGLRYLNKALAAQPDYPAALYNLARLHMRREAWEQSAEFFRRYLDLRPHDLNAIQMYAHALIRLEQWDKARVILQQTIPHLPHAAPLHMMLTKVLTQLNRDDEAMAALKVGVQLLDADTALTMIDKLQLNGLRLREDYRLLIRELAAVRR